MFRKSFLFLLFIFCLSTKAQIVVIAGQLIDEETVQGIPNAQVKLSNTVVYTTTDQNGEFFLTVLKRPAYQILSTHLAYNALYTKIKDKDADTIFVTLTLKQKPTLLDSIDVFAISKPETLVGKPQFSIYDFDFYDNKLILLTADNSLKQADLRLADYEGQLYDSWRIPKAAGLPKNIFHDYLGYANLVCNDSVFRVDALHTQLMISCMSKAAFENSIKPVADTLSSALLFSDQWDAYPVMNYYSLHERDSIGKLLKSISNDELLKLYKLEYYYLPPRGQLEARRMATELKTDKYIIAAMMSGFTTSMYYDPLYTPLFVVNDTICIFDHANDRLYHFDSENHLIDSVKISYHHPKNWREWKKQLFFDEAQQSVYALFSKDGHHYLKALNFQSGQIRGTYKLKHHSAERIRIRDGYVYYVYRPFESTQQKFLYRERITINN